MIDAILQNRRLERWSARPPRSILYEVLLVLAAVVTPFMLFGPAAGPVMAWFVLLVYVLSMALASAYDNGPRQSARITFIILLCGVPFFLIYINLTLIATIVWAWWPLQSGDKVMTVIGAAVAMIVASTLCIAFAPRLARGRDGAASEFLQGVRKQGIGKFSRGIFGAIVMIFGFIIYVAYVLLSMILGQAAERGVSGIETSWDLAVAYPILPLTLLIAAITLPLSRSLSYNRAETDAAVRAYIEGAASGQELDDRSKTVLGALSAFMFTVSVLIGSHTLAQMPQGGGAATATLQAVDGWVAEQREEGRTAAEIAAELNRTGGWTPDAPEAGLATLIEEPELVLAHGCSIVTAADFADLSGHGAIAWLPDEQAASDVKFCIRMTCPVSGQTEPMFKFVSSHATENESWGSNTFTDYFRQGRAPTPGGYCTVDGELSESFRG